MEMNRDQALEIIDAHDVEFTMNEEGELLFYNNYGLYEAYAILCDIAGINYWKPQ